ncbi:family 1 glycosylhydrolase [Nocardia stercoris]|uniref:Glycoside hydrolase family 1 protein n=1 Tax=Nocardia stercoris TaxID=2483361 RepID=A0A3M2L9X2_9NOCA|nr:family 1 glycosylhydrolase [Nocardia stercoris]RMI33500.1 glycoside hydrolase family 1 protein [Nocardia stercoris]
MRQWKRVLAVCVTATVVLVPGQAVAAPPATAGGLPSLGPGFLWGVSTSGFQSEGHEPDSNWSRYAASGAVGEVGDSVDFLNRYPADVVRAARLGAKVFRISIEWARVQPTPDGWDESAFAQYDGILNAIALAGMRPMITLDHWVYPGWEADRGGWTNPGMVDDWLANARHVVDRYAARKPLWVTVNEPLAYVGTERRIGAITSNEDADTMVDRLARVHNAAYDEIHRVQPDAMVTSNIGYVPGHETEVNQGFVDQVRGKLDFVGVDYYFGPSGDGTQAGAPGMWNLPLQTEGIYYALRHYARQFPGKPLFVVENGMPTENGQPRPDGYDRADHLRDTVYWIQRAKADGMNVIGYNYWSLTDNYEWGSYAPRFGLYTVDVGADPQLIRKPTDAVEAYATLSRAGGVPAGYTPTRAPVPCSQVDPPDSCDDAVSAAP